MSVHEKEDPSRCLTALEAARVLRFSVGTILRWAEAGRLPYVLVSGEKRFARSDLEAIAIRLNDSR